MLRTLYIQNFVLIKQLQLDFDSGMSVFTGETGAGKSIFIDAIGILIGGRFNTSMIRNGAVKCIIEGSFDVDEETAAKLEEMGLDSEDLIITREFTDSGKTVNRINGRSVTAASIRDILNEKIDIHCQRDSQYLLNSRYHLNLLDQYCGNKQLLKEVSSAYSEYRKLQSEYDRLESSDYSAARLEITEYQLKELNSLKLKAGEDEEIEEQLKKAQAREKTAALVENTREIFTSDDGILTRLYEFTRNTDGFGPFSEISGNIENIVNAYYSISDDYESIIGYFDSDDLSVEDIDALNSRLYELQRAKRKYNLDIDGLLALKKQLEEKLDSYSNREFALKEAMKKADEAYEIYLSKASAIRKIRQDKDVELEQKVVEQLKDLNLENAVFKTSFSKGKDTASGNDDVEFLISMNKGMRLQPLSDAASGGETSRLMLGLKTVFSSLQGTRLIIFDEIDSGVSGYVAFNMGLKMKEISRRCQVFAVTHLAPVAAFADHHFHIEKTQSDTTVTDVVELDHDGRIHELAVLSSAAVTSSSLAAADELYQKAGKACK